MPLRCDQCAEVIHPGTPCGVLFADRLVGQDEDTEGFELMRIECTDCCPHKLYYDAVGYSEFLLMSEFDPNGIMNDVHVVDTSSRTDGLEWDTEEIADLLHMLDDPSVQVSPSDMMRILSMHFDPRDVVDPETGDILIPPEDYESFRILYALTITQKEQGKDALKAIQQSTEDDISIEEIERHRKRMRSDLENYVDEIIL